MSLTDNLSDYVLGVLSTSGGEPWTPVHVQKMFFLLDNRLVRDIHGPRWNFYAHDYGPFDPAVYRQLNALEQEGRATKEIGAVRSYRLTPQGQRDGERALEELSSTAQDYVRRLSAWVRSLSFPVLVSAVYEEFPDMKVNSVFRR